jgi:hypothetical protein
MPLGLRAWLGHQLLCVAQSPSPPSLDIFVESHPKPPAAIGGNGSIEEFWPSYARDPSGKLGKLLSPLIILLPWRLGTSPGRPWGYAMLQLLMYTKKKGEGAILKSSRHKMLRSWISTHASIFSELRASIFTYSSTPHLATKIQTNLLPNSISALYSMQNSGVPRLFCSNGVWLPLLVDGVKNTFLKSDIRLKAYESPLFQDAVFGKEFRKGLGKS